MHTVEQQSSRLLKRVGSVPLAIGLVLLFSVVVSAASYIRTTLKDLTQRAVAVADVQVTGKEYPALQPGQTFPRTYVEVKVLSALKGTLPDTFVLDLPGGINGNIVSHVSDSPEFRINERAMVFVKEPEKGHFMVQDLGLGKFNIVERDGKTFVESPLCPKAVVPAQMKEQTDLDATLMTRSIPYKTFCDLIGSYATGETPKKDAALLAAELGESNSHQHNQVPLVLADAREMQHARTVRTAWMAFALVLSAVVLAAALWVRHRRRTQAAPVTTRTVVLILTSALLGGAGLGGATSHGFVQFDLKTTWALDTPLAGRVANTRIIWRQSTAVSKTNSNAFTNVQQSFDKWNNVSGSRLAFTAGGQTTITINDANDGQNTVAWTPTPSSDFSTSTLALTFSSFTQATPSTFVDADIIFDDRDFNWGPGGTGNPSSVSLHEIGHFIGLQHTTDNTTVMFPFDQGFTDLSPDEISAAQTLYPSGTQNSAPPPGSGSPQSSSPAPSSTPNAAVDASPLGGPKGTAVQFTTNSSPGPSNQPITQFSWNFSDGTTLVTSNGNPVSHTFTSVGEFTVTLTVTDAANGTASASVVIEIGQTPTVPKGGFKLNFKSDNGDQMSIVLSDPSLVGANKPKGTAPLDAFFTFGDLSLPFTYDPVKGKNTDKGRTKVAVNFKSGTVTIQVKGQLQEMLAGHGATNATVSGVTVDVPVDIWFGKGSGLYLFGDAKFNYSAIQDKGGVGKL